MKVLSLSVARFKRGLRAGEGFLAPSTPRFKQGEGREGTFFFPQQGPDDDMMFSMQRLWSGEVFLHICNAL